MKNVVIKVENLSKKYIIGGAKKHSTLRDKIDDFLHHPFRSRVKNRKEDFWALKNISFKVNRGDVVGIIGKNGSGKSTLLKTLSRIVEPTKGMATLKGRVASLLEVGTGFNPELTGRENVFLNGAILGMTQKEVAKKFDEIVAFSGVKKFIDTPVKRYSSGMYVRLAFAVAAHLDSDILLVDEVLAVGDAEFQKKCLGKMKDLAGSGRTVVFVSHNMGAIQQLCNRAIFIQKGKIGEIGNPKVVINNYLKTNLNKKSGFNENDFEGNLINKISYKKIKINGEKKDILVSPNEEIVIEFCGRSSKAIKEFYSTLVINHNGVRLLTSQDIKDGKSIKKGEFKSIFTIPPLMLRPGEYSVGVGAWSNDDQEWMLGNDLITFTVLEKWSKEFRKMNLGIVNLTNDGVRKQ